MLRLADRAAKRAIDVLVAGGLLVLLVPLIALASILIVVDSPGGAFFRCERAGFRGRRLRMLKFRKMREGASGRALTMDDDDRFTRIGPWLAKFKLDEVPQLWHVVRGEMSLVGPRPEDPSFVERHGSAYDHILSVRPGHHRPLAARVRRGEPDPGRRRPARALRRPAAAPEGQP